MPNTRKPKILIIDIETQPAMVYVWGLFKQNIGLEQVIDHGGMICFGAKWMGDKTTMMFSQWEHGTDVMVNAAHALLCEADAVVTYNGDKFDLPKLNGEFVQNGLKPPPPPTSIDVWKTTRQLGLVSSKLGFVGPLLEVGKKIDHEGFGLWRKVMDGDTKAQKRMEKYCIQDVVLLEKVYKKIRPYVKNHPHVDLEKTDACPSCGSHHLQKRGFRRTRLFKIQRLQCQDCGAWSAGTMQKIKRKSDANG